LAELSVTCPKCSAANNVALGAEVETYTCSGCGAENQLVDGGPVEAAVDPLIGAVISDCKIIEKLGEGGFGAVYKAQDQNLARPVALKVMLQSLTSSQEFVQKFIREAITAAQLNHPNIVAIHKVGRDEKRGIHYLIMELLDGKTLEHIVQDKGVLKPEEAVPLILQASEALAAAHDKKIVHRDIKPENLMVDKRGVVKIMDFGLAKVVQPDMKSTKVMGTPHYMSPEQFEGKQVDGRTDIYSLGVTFYYILSRARPYEGTNTVQIIYAILTSDPRSLLDASPGTPPEIWTIIQKMIAKKPDERYSDFRAVRKDLLAYQEKSLADRVVCPQCGARNQRGKKFCRQCGGNLQVKCPACNADEVAGAQTCSACGAAIEALLAVRQNMERALRLKSVGDLRRAYLLLKEVLKIDPNHAEAKKEVDEIDGALREVESVKTEAVELEKTGNLEDALKKVEDLLGRYPGSDDIKRHRDVIKRAFDSRIIAQHMRRADENMAAGNLNGALVALDAALRLDPKREDILASRRDLEEKVKSAEEARGEARRAFETRRYAEAFRRATEVLRNNPTDSEMAQILEKCRGFLESSEDFVRRGREHLDAGRFVDAKQELEAAIQLRPEDAEVKELLAQTNLKLSAFRDLLVEARTALGDAQFEAARTKVSEVLKTLPGDPEALGLMATIARQESEARKAGEVSKGIEQGEALEKKGQYEEALAAYRAAVEADPDSSRAVQARDRLEARMREVSSVRALADEHLRDGRFEEALGALERLVKLLPDDKDIAGEAEEARDKVKHIQENLRKAEKAAQGKDHKGVVEAAKAVLDLSPNHVRAASLRRDAERAVNAIDRHVKEAERLIASEIFEDALDQLKKARQKGASQEQVAGFEKTAVDGITAALKTEATRFYSAKDYSAALDAFDRIIELRPTDEDAKKGKKEAEKRLRALTSEPIAMRSVVSGAAAAVLLMFQVAAVQFRAPPSLRNPDAVVGPVVPILKPFEKALILPLEKSGDFAKALETWDTQEPSQYQSRIELAHAFWDGLQAARTAGEKDAVAGIRVLQELDARLDKDGDAEIDGVRQAAAVKLLDDLQGRALEPLLAAEKAGEQDRIMEIAPALMEADLTNEGFRFLKASKLYAEANRVQKSFEADFAVGTAFRLAKRNRTAAQWLKAGEKIADQAKQLDPEKAKAFTEKYRAQLEREWKDDLKKRFAESPKGGGLLQAIEEAEAFLVEFKGLGDDEAEWQLIKELGGTDTRGK
jgi:tetratricopeptide (TPR) repeat protein/tRNA A-37 threonylcarbamoyl transferase component Bud32